MSTFLSNGYLVLDTRSVDPTLVIGMSFICISYFLHPMVESAYRRVRAYRAWRAVEKRQAVEVTNYPMLADIFGARGKWDTGRVITVLMAMISLAIWGLELQMGLANIEGLARPLNQPPPVVIGVIDGFDVWLVKAKSFDLGSVWRILPNMFEDHAKSRYYMEDGGRHSGTVNGNIVVASWYTEPAETLFYYAGDHAATIVEGLQCADDVAPKRVSVFVEGVEWGTVIECDKGPTPTPDLLPQRVEKNGPPPAIIMTNSEDEVFLIMEEISSSPSFLYSVWTVVSVNSTSTELKHEFHIAATMRLAEAVVTGVVHGEISGGGCFGLLREYSENRAFDDNDNAAERALPFGERPNPDSKANIQDTETITFGLKINVIGLLCLVCFIGLTCIGVMWAISLHSSMDVDVYDRDELVRAAVFSGVAKGDTQPSATGRITPSATRIFVRKEEMGNISVTVSDDNNTKRICSWTVCSGLLALVSLASWRLELSEDLVLCSGDVRNLPPPPIILVSGNGSHVWQVIELDQRDHVDNWKGLPNTFEDQATSRYHMENGSSPTGDVNDGDSLVAYCYTESDETLFYYLEDLATAVGDHECADEESPDSTDVECGNARETSAMNNE